MPDIRVKRVYDPADPADGYRVLVDRVWPRGVSKERAAVDEWLREIGPSDSLRKWFGHDPAKWEGFTERYEAELEASRPLAADLLRRVPGKRLTLVYSARDERHNQAVALAAFLRRRIG